MQEKPLSRWTSCCAKAAGGADRRPSANVAWHDTHEFAGWAATARAASSSVSATPALCSELRQDREDDKVEHSGDSDGGEQRAAAPIARPSIDKRYEYQEHGNEAEGDH